jgi:PmbA protein
VTLEEVRQDLHGRAAGRWELYEKRAESWELERSRELSRSSWRREEGWAARWWQNGGPRLASGSSLAELSLAIAQAARIPAPEEPAPEWPSRVQPPPAESAAERAPDLFDELSRALSAASRGEAQLASLSLRRGRVAERIVNGAGLDVAQSGGLFDGIAAAVGRRAGRTHEVRMPLRFAEAPEIEPLARRLADAATLPLSDRPTPFSSGQWLLDPGVAAALLAAIAPLFCREKPPRWIGRGRAAAPGVCVADDARADAPFDGEGVPTRRVLLLQDGEIAGHLYDLRSALRAGKKSTGHGVRGSYRMGPRVSARRILFEAEKASSPAQLLSSVTRGLFAAALTAPVRVDLDEDRYQVEFTGISVVAGRAQGPVAGARASGRVSELLRRIAALSTDLQFFPMPFPSGAPTLLVEKATFS